MKFHEEPINNVWTIGNGMSDGMSDHMDSLNDRLDRMAGRLSPGGIKEPREPEGEDRMVLKLFPYFLVVCAVFWVAVMLYLDEWTVAKGIEMVCLVFVSAFAVIGFACVYYMDSGPFPKHAVFIYSLVISVLLWFSMSMFGNQPVIYGVAVRNIFRILGFDLGLPYLDIIGLAVTVIIMFFTTSAVLYVTVAYLRVYMTRVFVSMQQHADQGVRGKAEWFFMVPDIIDVDRIEISPDRDEHAYSLRSFVQLMLYTVILGMFISSYLFVNPYFLVVMTPQTMLAIMTMLTMFVPVLVIPWQIVQQLGVRATSGAARPYYLWIGAKRRLFSTFAALGVFMMMFVISVYFGNDVIAIIRNYVLFLFPLIAAAAMYSLLYSNNFNKSLRDSICKGFKKGVSQGREGL